MVESNGQWLKWQNHSLLGQYYICFSHCIRPVWISSSWWNTGSPWYWRATCTQFAFDTVEFKQAINSVMLYSDIYVCLPLSLFEGWWLQDGWLCEMTHFLKTIRILDGLDCNCCCLWWGTINAVQQYHANVRKKSVMGVHGILLSSIDCCGIWGLLPDDVVRDPFFTLPASPILFLIFSSKASCDSTALGLSRAATTETAWVSYVDMDTSGLLTGSIHC